MTQISVQYLITPGFQDDRIPPLQLWHVLLFFAVATPGRDERQRRDRIDARFARDLRDLALQLVQLSLHAHAGRHLLELAVLVEVERALRPHRRLDGHAGVEEAAVGHTAGLLSLVLRTFAHVSLEHLALLGADVGFQRGRVLRQ